MGRSRRVDLLRTPSTVFPAEETILQSTQQAREEAEAWLAGHAT